MKRMIFYLALLVAALAIPKDRTDLGKLKPVETVSLYIEKGEVVLATDTEDLGKGKSVDQALENMKETAAGIIYLDTADYLLVRKGAELWIPDMKRQLKGNVRICYAQPAVDITRAASFLTVHRPDMKLEEWTEGAGLQTLGVHGEHMILRNEKS